MTLAIDIKNLHKTYRTATGGLREALRGVDLAIEADELFGFVGVNGAGKSTLIKSLVGLLRPSGGEASIFGFPAGSTQARSMLGYLPEVSNYHEFLTARELLSIHAALAGLPRAQRAPRSQEVLQIVGLGDRAKTRLSEFSKGMKQRFGIAQAMIAKPRLLILDELTSGLDPLAQLELKEIMIDLRKQGTTIFFSSHHMAEVEAVCDRVGILHSGRLRAVGRLDELLLKPDTVQVCVELEPEARTLLASQFGLEVGEDCSFHLARTEVDGLLEFVRQHQGHLVSLAPCQISLEEFYIDTVRKANREDGVAS